MSRFFLFLMIVLIGYPDSPLGGVEMKSTPASSAQEALEILQAYLRIDTTNPPGNEMTTALFLKDILDREQIENYLFDLGGNRACLFALLRGTGPKKGMVLLHHMDVVPAEPKFWSQPPFAGKIVRGEVYGRGAVDIKGKGVIDLMTLLRVKREKIPLKRDLALLAVADEEVGSIGSRYMIEKQFPLFKNFEILIDEGAWIHGDDTGAPTGWFVSFGEKSPLWISLEFSGPPGHGSCPLEESAVNRAIRAGQKILDRKIDLVVRPEFLESIRAYLRKQDITRLKGYSTDLETSLKNPLFLEEIARDDDIRGSLSNTIAITGMKGSDKTNVIPNTASLRLDCRLLPGVNKEIFLDGLKKLIADPKMKITIEEYFESGQSRLHPEFFTALKAVAAKRHPGVPVVPNIVLSSTDGSFFRKLGLAVYGFEPYILKRSDESLAHGNDERMSEKNIELGLDIMLDLVREMNR